MAQKPKSIMYRMASFLVSPGFIVHLEVDLRRGAIERSQECRGWSWPTTLAGKASRVKKMAKGCIKYFTSSVESRETLWPGRPGMSSQALRVLPLHVFQF